MIHGERVRQAREFRGLTQTELASRIGAEQSSIALIESGQRQPSQGLLEAIAIQTGFPPAFFRLGAPPQFSVGSLLFRSQRSTAAWQRNQAQRYGEIVYESSLRMAARVVTTNPLRLPKLDPGTTPEEAADLTRASLGIGPDRPVPHLINLIERSGVLVLALPTQLPKRDAFSLWTDSQPVTPLIVLSQGVPGDRLRFSVAHELGHLVMHSALRGTTKTIERDADRFASEFLMPESGVAGDLHPPVTLTRLAELKPQWGVSIQALATRARTLDLITEPQRSYLFRQLSLQGWRKQEPVELIPEKPRAYRKMAELLYGNPPDVRRLAYEASLPLGLVDEIIEAHASLNEQPLRPAPEPEPSNIVKFRLKPEPSA